jgi:hypothetical protein
MVLARINSICASCDDALKHFYPLIPPQSTIQALSSIGASCLLGYAISKKGLSGPVLTLIVKLTEIYFITLICWERDARYYDQVVADRSEFLKRVYTRPPGDLSAEERRTFYERLTTSLLSESLPKEPPPLRTIHRVAASILSYITVVIVARSEGYHINYRRTLITTILPYGLNLAASAVVPRLLQKFLPFYIKGPLFQLPIGAICVLSNLE